ncbi:MAG: UDP-N-acetylmuramate--L-alanine ligase [Oscillospiraceae bacterium]|nr:UDP-N-acetylmuramate--L-alanine ligase [Oscillospiraceae bacterium]
MSALARILLSFGYEISGSDTTKSDLIESLKNDGADIAIGHSADNIQSPDLVVFTAAIDENEPELLAARALGVPVIERSILLGEIMTLYKYPINIAGTHGKTTVTSMLSLILLDAEVDPTILVGGELSDIGGNLKIGALDYLVCEACEYVDSFLQFKPFISVINNIEEDHMDYFKDLDQIIGSFAKFANLTSPVGAVVANFDDENVRTCAKSVNVPIVTYGIDNSAADFSARNVQFIGHGSKFDLYRKGERYAEINLQVTGEHNIYNALAAIATADTLNIPIAAIISGLSKFRGTRRRFEYLGKTANGATVVDDYAHHPTEIRTTLNAAKKMDYDNVWCIFQPHTYTRTNAFLDDFAAALSIADRAILIDIYAAREINHTGVSSKDIADKHAAAVYIPEFEEAAKYAQSHAGANDLIITMGAGDVWKTHGFINFS